MANLTRVVCMLHIMFTAWPLHCIALRYCLRSEIVHLEGVNCKKKAWGFYTVVMITGISFDITLMHHRNIKWRVLQTRSHQIECINCVQKSPFPRIDQNFWRARCWDLEQREWQAGSWACANILRNSLQRLNPHLFNSQHFAECESTWGEAQSTFFTFPQVFSHQ